MIRTITLPALFLATLAPAQVTITASMLPSGTFTDQLYRVASQGESAPPTPGADQTWDFSTATLQSIGTFTHEAASGTPHTATYPEADIAWRLHIGFLGTNYTYLKSGTALDMVATDVPGNTNAFTDHMRLLRFPLNIGESFTDTWAGTEGSGTIAWTYAGHGTAITPVGTFSDVVLMVRDDGEIAMWRTSPLVPLLFERNGNLLAVGPTSVGVQEHAGERLAVYPVPCADRLLVQHTDAAPWRIVDMQGRTMAEGRFAAVGSHVVDTDALAPGAYLLVQQGDGMRRVARFVKE